MKKTPIDFNGIDTAVHGPLRLGILTSLLIHGPLDFTTLKKTLDAQDGSLNLHLGKLEELGYIRSTKAFVGARPKTTYAIQTPGRKSLRNYLAAMQQLIHAVENA